MADPTAISPEEAERLWNEIEKQECEESLAAFVKAHWHVVEPATPLVWGWVLDAMCLHLEAVSRGEITRLCMNVCPGMMKSLLVNVFWPAWEWGPRKMPHLRYVTASYAQKLTIRDNGRFRRVITSEKYRKHWGSVFGESADQFNIIHIENDKTGWKLATSVGGMGTGARGDRFLIDDANDANEAESEAVLDSTSTWIREVVPDRLNNLEKSVIINIQQRTSEKDATATLMEMDVGYTFFMVPMEFDPDRKCKTSIGWQDPRKKDGELAWPERFPEKVVQNIKKSKGPFAYCTPHEAPILMADLSMKQIGDVEIGDEIVGFTTDTKAASGDSFVRKKLCRAKVLSISKSVQKLVKITLSSGKIIRCTPDHKWYVGKKGGFKGIKKNGKEDHRPLYRPAKLGSKLMRICPPEIPKLTSEEDLRLAGWLSGFYDGEGSAVMMKKKGSAFRRSCLITFAQGAGRNLPLCEKLEKTLSYFGFTYGYDERVRNDRKKDRETAHKSRYYYLTGNSLPLYQKFLHLIKPTKWRERMIEGAYGANFIRGEEEVLSIEPDGEEIVYGLETTTGNYVVWGLASSNSGQYQQLPSPRGGGIIPLNMWMPWGNPKNPDDEFYKTYPPMDYIIAILDTAMTAKEENDYSALVVLGLWRDKYWMPKIMLMDAWHERLNFHELVEKVIQSCKNSRYRIDKLLIEDKAAGHSVAQEMRRLLLGKEYSIQLITPKGDKVARAYSVQHLFAEKMIYAPWKGEFKPWAQLVINELAVLPKGAHDDLADSIIHGIRYLRDCGWALNRHEQQEIYDKEFAPTGPQEALYDC